jgi:DNA polymerase-3 subunit epsilon
MQHQNADNEALACQLEATGDYKVLRRLTPRRTTATPTVSPIKVGIIIDFETTGTDFTNDEIIEIAMVKFRYDDSDQIISVEDTFEAFNQPSVPIPANIVELTGITDAMVAGRSVDATSLEVFVADANIVIAHNAGFDRKFAERSWSVFEHKHWACSMAEIDWRKHGFGGTKLEYLLADAGFFHDAHRAIGDCHATLELLARPLPVISKTAFEMLVNHARRKTYRVWAQHSPYEVKDVLRRRGYRWNDGTDGSPRSWRIDVEEDKRDAELNYLRKEIYQRDVDIDWREITALNRFSNRA